MTNADATDAHKACDRGGARRTLASWAILVAIFILPPTHAQGEKTVNAQLSPSCRHQGVMLAMGGTGNGSSQKKDTVPPNAVMAAPKNGGTNVPVDQSMEIHVKDADSGVDKNTIKMKVGGVDVTSQAIMSGGPSDYALTYSPAAFFPYDTTVIVKVNAADQKGNSMTTQTFTFTTASPPEALSAPDKDKDGIPDDMELNVLNTDPQRKTLFVRPCIWPCSGPQFSYWEGFKKLLPLPPFENAKIEIVVIGDNATPYAPMQHVDYDPAKDATHPPCDILNVAYMDPDSFVASYHHNCGHTYFDTLKATWYWDTKGFTPNDSTTMQYRTHRYFTPQLYAFPLKNYFKEAAYQQIDLQQVPLSVPLTGSSCRKYSGTTSPLNLNQSAPRTGPPDDTVEFNPIVFNGQASIAQLPSGLGGAQEYLEDEVLRRTLVHEMGHALLGASILDHCANPGCIMYEGVVDWKLNDFGYPCTALAQCPCTHSVGGSHDIREKIHNSPHFGP